MPGSPRGTWSWNHGWAFRIAQSQRRLALKLAAERAQRLNPPVRFVIGERLKPGEEPQPGAFRSKFDTPKRQWSESEWHGYDQGITEYREAMTREQREEELRRLDRWMESHGG